MSSNHLVIRPFLWLLLAPWILLAPNAAADPPDRVVDLAALATDGGLLHRTHGYTGTGLLGVPVAGGADCDGDGLGDYGFSSMRASPAGRSGAGEAYLIFGDGTISGTLDSAVPQERILRVIGAAASEAAGSEIWMDDVTGDGVGDLLICRQNYSPGMGREGAGALTIVVGGAHLRAHAATLQPLDLANPPAGIPMFHLVGAAARDRVGIWVRTDDVSGDGIHDVVVGADQQTVFGAPHAGGLYVVRGGSHLAAGGTADLAAFGSTPIEGHLARILPPLASNHYHFGATCQVADLDGNGRAEVMAAATLARAGASIQPAGTPPGSTHASGGTADGTLYIAWDTNFPAGLWPTAFSIRIDVPATTTIIDGGKDNRTFGEEILGGLDYDGDGTADLFVGDLVADGTVDQSRSVSGIGYVLYDAASLKSQRFDLDAPPPGLVISTMLGPSAGALAGDTAIHGDFDGDGFDDLAVGSPHGEPAGRNSAGIVHVLHGRQGVWPANIDLAAGALPPASAVRITEIQGARGGQGGGDNGDTLAYSAAAGDVDGDGRMDLIVNEMAGNGVAPQALDVGNLLVISGDALADSLFVDGFETGGIDRWSTSEGLFGAEIPTCVARWSGDVSCL